MAADWEKILDDQMAQWETRAPRRSMAINYPNDLYALVMTAARQRDLTMTAYQRRASVAFACVDLQRHWVEEMEAEPPVGRFYAPQARELHAGYDFGRWKILTLGEWDRSDE